MGEDLRNCEKGDLRWNEKAGPLAWEDEEWGVESL